MDVCGNSRRTGTWSTTKTCPGKWAYRRFCAPWEFGYAARVLVDNEYFPTLNAYDSVNQPKFSRNLPKSIADGTNGREMVGTYQPHDFTPGTRQLNHLRQAAAWQVQEFPPDFRNLLSWQQVQKYRVLSMTAQARPLSSADYFLGYQINPDISAKIGQTTMGVMGSM